MSRRMRTALSGRRARRMTREPMNITKRLLLGLAVFFTACGAMQRVAIPTTTAGTSVSQLVFVTQPSNSTTGQTLTTAPVVEARDVNGNRVLSFSGNITVSIGTNPGGG